MPTVLERLDSLESILGQFIVHTDVALRRLENEIREFKNEMREFKNEMKEFKDEIRNEMKDFKDEMREETKKKNGEWSNLAQKMGTMVEDLIAPALRPVLGKYFNSEVTMEGQRMFRHKAENDYEVDAISADEKRVFMIEVKTSPKEKDIDAIVQKAKQFFEFFPEFEKK